VQIIGRRLKDEILLQHAKVMEKILVGEDLGLAGFNHPC
jgi:hypothetical protein